MSTDVQELDCPTCHQPLVTVDEDRSQFACENWRCGWYREVWTREEMDRRIERARREVPS